MSIEPIDPTIHSDLAHTVTGLRRPHRTRETGTRTAVPEEPVQTPSPEKPDQADKVRGVIRLLEAGHFSGVADVRLRINFFDELANRANAARASVLREGAGDVVDTVHNGVTELLASADFDAEAQEPINAALEDFESETRALLEGGAAAAPSVSDSLRDAITPIFDTLVAGLTELLTTGTEDPDPPGTGEITPPEPDAIAPPESAEGIPTEFEESGETIVTLDQALADLRAAFEGAVATLIASLESAPRLPDPSPPSGNGRAFERFLELYNGLRQHAPEIDEES